MYKHKHFKFSVSDPEETDLTLVSVEDERTGFIVRTALPNAGKQTASIMAFAGARFSRSAMSAHDIFKEVKDSGKNANEKLANIFKNYGHSSVGDMAQIFTYIENAPINYHIEFFYDTRIGGGQARSTRYQNYSESSPVKFSLFIEDGKEYPELEKEYTKIYNKAIEHYGAFYEKTLKAYTKHYKPEKDNRGHKGALTARTLDTARVFLPIAASDSWAYITSAREWARLISVMKADNRRMVQYLGEQLEILFAPPKRVTRAIEYTPEAPDLIRHTRANHGLEKSLDKIFALVREKLSVANEDKFAKEFEQEIDVLSNDFSSAEIALLQVLLTYHPNLKAEEFVELLENLSPAEKKKISKLMYKKFNHHSQLGRQAELSSYSYKISASLSELKDLNRHRAWAKFAPIWETDNVEELLNDGYVLPLYLQVDAFSDLKKAYKRSLKSYYKLVREFYEKLPVGINKRLIIGLLPQSHRIDYYMHGSPKEISFMTKLRIRPGGHINYRMLAYMLGQETAEIEPLLSGLGFKKSEKPDPASREEFFDRS